VGILEWMTPRRLAAFLALFSVLCLVHLYLAFFFDLNWAKALYGEDGEPEMEVIFYFACGVAAALCWLRRNEPTTEAPAA